MNRTRIPLCLLLGLAWLGVAGPRGLAAQLVPLGPEVDLLADTWPSKPFVAVQPDGAYLVAWDEGSPAWGVVYRYVAAGSTPKEEWPSTIADDVVARVGNSWLVTWGAAQVPAGDFSTVFVRRFARKK